MLTKINRMSKLNNKQKGYSLPQMLTATAVGAVLTGVATTNYWSAVDKSRITAELETFERIGEAMNVVLASDQGRTTFLTAKHKELLQELVPKTGSELEYSIKSTWQGDTAEGNHSYAISLVIYPKYSGKITPATGNDYASGATNTVTVNGKLYRFVSPASTRQLPSGVTSAAAAATAAAADGNTPKTDVFFAVAAHIAINGGFEIVLLQSATQDMASATIVSDATFLKAAGETVIDGYTPETGTAIPNSIGMQKIALIAKGLDYKIDGTDQGKATGLVQYKDSCKTGADDCNIHVYLVDRGYGVDGTKGSNGTDWFADTFIDDFKKKTPTSTIQTTGQKNSIVVLGSTN